MRRLIALLVPLFLAACSPGRTVEAVALLRDLSDAPSWQDVTRTEVAGPADLYRGADARAALVVVPGAAEAGRRDPRLVAFAADLARARFLVMVPQLGGRDPLQVSAADADAVAAAVRQLTDLADVPQVGLVGISYAAGPAVLAALQVPERVAFVAVTGGYHDITAAITYLTTGYYQVDGAWRRGPVEPRARWLFLRANADRVTPEDTPLLAAIADRRLADPQAPVGDLAADLGPEGRAVWSLLANADPTRVPDLIAALPEGLRREIAALDLAGRDLSGLDLLLIHGRDDPMVPWTESLALAERSGGRLYVVDGLVHVDLGALGADGVVTLIRAAYALLAERDAAPEPAAVPPVPPEPGAEKTPADQGRRAFSDR